MPRNPGVPRTPAFLAAALALALTARLPAQQTHLPAGRPAPDAALDDTLHRALPPGATQVAQPLPVDLGPLGRVLVVLFRRSANDPSFRGLALIPAAHNTFRAVPLPDEEPTGTDAEEITTAVLGADIVSPDPGASVPGGLSQGLPETLPPGPGAPSSINRPTSTMRLPETGEGAPAARANRPESGQRALVILFYTHQPGQTDSTAFGRVYLYEQGAFRIDHIRSRLLDGVRTAAVVRLRLAPNP